MKPRTKDKVLSEKRSLREEKRRSLNREAILHAAEAVICRKGLSATSMDDVSAEAGYSKATVYKYIPSKNELVFELMIHFLEDVRERTRAITERPLAPETKLHDFLREILRQQMLKENIARAFLADPSLFRIIHAVSGEKQHALTAAEAGFLQRMTAVRRAISILLESILSDGIASGVFRPFSLDDGARFLGAVIQGYQHEKFFQKGKPDLEKDVLSIYTFVLNGFSTETRARV